MSTAPMSDPQTMPLDELRQQVTAPPDPQPVAAPEPVAAPVPAPAPEQFSVQQDDSGVTVQMGAEFGGEVFKGKDWAEVGPKIAKAKADANAYARTLKAQIPQPAAPPAPAVDPQESAVDEWLLERTAKALGMSKEQYVSRMQMTFQSSEKMAINATLADFHASCPDYSDTPENNAVITGYFPQDLDHFPSATELKQAYAMALYEGRIQRVPPSAARPGAPPPMPGVTASSTGGENPWTMDKDALRRQVVGQ